MGLVDLEELALGLGDDSIVDRLQVLEELGHVLGADMHRDVETETVLGRHGIVCEYASFFLVSLLESGCVAYMMNVFLDID